MLSTRYSGPILTKVEFSQQIFEKYSNIQFNENPSSGSRVIQCANTQDEANSRSVRTHIKISTEFVAFHSLLIRAANSPL